MATAQSNRALWLTILSILMIETAPAASSSSPKSIYDALSSHGLPMGLFPKGVNDYTIDEEGWFEVHLNQACNAKFESELHYDRNVTGRLSYGQIRNLTGIAAQELFLWFPVKGIRVDIPSSGLIYFDVGVVFKQFSLSLFETPPDCVAGALSPPDGGDEEGELLSRVLDKLQNGKGYIRYPLDHQGESAREPMHKLSE